MKRRFLILLLLVLVVAVWGLLLIVIYRNSHIESGDTVPGVTELWPTNLAVDTAISQTQTAKAWTVTPSPQPK
jgi:hypothetical protein